MELLIFMQRFWDKRVVFNANYSHASTLRNVNMTAHNTLTKH